MSNIKGAGIAARGLGKAFMNAIKSIKPTIGTSKTDEYLRENQRKLAQAKVKLKAMQKVDKDVEAGYQSVKTKFKGGK